MVDPRRAAALVLMAASGCAALGYQMVWTQQAALGLGHDGAAALAVVAAFFGGLSLGAWWLGRRVADSARPALWYAGCEAVVALWCGVLWLLMEPATAQLVAWVGADGSAPRQALICGLGTFVLLLPATMAMGASLPAMNRVLAHGQAGGTLAGLYAANTWGGVVGVLGATFWAVPHWGLAATALLCALLNLLCALLAWRLALRMGRSPAPKPSTPCAPRRWAWLLAATGLLGVGYEVMALRALSQVAENTVYTLALLLAVYLLGTAWGAAYVARRPASAPALKPGLLLAGLGLSCALGAVVLWLAPWFRSAAALLLGGGYAAGLAGEALLAVLAFGPPTLLMGASFSTLAAAAEREGLALGPALAANTAGAALAAPLVAAGLWLADGAAGSTMGALALLVAGYALVACAWVPRPRVAVALGAMSALALANFPEPRWLDLPPGTQVLSRRDGLLGQVSVVESARGERLLHINHRAQEGSNATALADARQAVLPLLLHPAPQRALFLGLGTGVTARAAALDAQLQVDAVELLPDVVQASRLFHGALGEGDAAAAQRLKVHVADARRYVRTSAGQWDVIVADNVHPARAGTGSLYTREHFTAVRARLAQGGWFCQWLPLHQMDMATLQTIVRTFVQVYPGAQALLATNSLATPVLGLLGPAAGGGSLPDAAAVAQRIAAVQPRVDLERFGLGQPWAVLGSVVADAAVLAHWSQGAPLNTDDHPVVAHLAPRATYAPEAAPAERLTQVLHAWPVPAAEARVLAYRQARRAYLQAGVGVRPVDDPAQMLAQIRQPLMKVLQLSPDFEPARTPLSRMATALQPQDPAAARALREELARLQPLS